MGPTGAGKSTVRSSSSNNFQSTYSKQQFINAAAGGNVAGVGHGLKSCTSKTEAIPIPYPSMDDPARRIVLVDTPGFGDDDTEALRRISAWLTRS